MRYLQITFDPLSKQTLALDWIKKKEPETDQLFFLWMGFPTQSDEFFFLTCLSLTIKEEEKRMIHYKTSWPFTQGTVHPPIREAINVQIRDYDW